MARGSAYAVTGSNPYRAALVLTMQLSWRRASIAWFVLAVGITFTIGWRPFFGPRARPLTTWRFAPTPERLARGTYLVKHVTPCMECHAPHQPLPGMDFGGGFVFDGPWGRVASANLTPDPSGIPYYDVALFTEVLRTGYAKARSINQIMPWHEFRGMTDERYLRHILVSHNAQARGVVAPLTLPPAPVSASMEAKTTHQLRPNLRLVRVEYKHLRINSLLSVNRRFSTIPL
jgi:hypothetical protein